jgi:hypothetical protein
MSHVKDIAELSQLSIERLKALLGNDVGAQQLWDFFHKKPDTNVISTSKRFRLTNRTN